MYIISTFLILARIHGAKFGAESWQDHVVSKVAWNAEFPDDPAYWNPPVAWDTRIPSAVGRGHHNAYHSLADSFKACVGNDTCYRIGWVEGDGVLEI